MDIWSTDITTLIGLGALVGFCSATLGIGGGIFIVSLLPWLNPDLSQRQVIATSLLAGFLIVSLNSYFFHRKKLVLWKLATVMGPAGALAAYLSARMGFAFSDRGLKQILAVVLGIFVLKTLFHRQWKQLFKTRVEEGSLSVPLAWGLSGGTVGGLIGIGGGTIFGPVLLGFPWIKNEKISPTTNGIMIFTHLAALLPFLSWHPDQFPGQYLQWADSLTIFAVSALTAYWGRKWQHLIAEPVRRFILCFILAGLTARVALTL